MRHSMRSLVGMMLVGLSCCHTMAAESGPKWWPFGQSRETDAAQSTTTPSTDTLPPVTSDESVISDQSATVAQYPTAPESETDRRWMISSPFAKVSWPRIQLPEMSKPQLPPSPFLTKAEIDAAKNSWVEKNPNPAKPSPVQAVKDGARRVGESTRNAWDKTVDALTPGERSQANDPTSRVARRERPPVWKRMFGAGDPQEVEGPQTVTEWMAQDRIDP